MKNTHQLELKRVVRRGTNHVTNNSVSVGVQIDTDSEINSSVMIPFCDGEKITPLDESLPFYTYTFENLIKAGFDEVKIISLKK